jgi:uncharacterized membrane protein YeaQ/YmgE (transglycosylase-associated protein family)
MKRNTIKNIVGGVVGAIGGYLYYYYIGCQNGSCAIKSNPYAMILWGALMGYLVFDFFKMKQKKQV